MFYLHCSRLLRYLSCRTYIRFTPRQIFLRKINSSKPPAPPIRGISRLPVAVPAGRFICIALGFCDIWLAPYIRFTPRQIFLRKINSSKPPAPPIRGISRLPVAVPAGRFICIALGFCDICPAGHIYGSRLGKANKFALLSASAYI